MVPSLVLLTAWLSADSRPIAPPVIEPELALFAPALSAIAQDTVPGPNEVKWTGSVNIGASYTDGNTDSRAVNAGADAERRAEKDRWTAKAFWNYSEQKDQTTGDFDISVRKAGASLKYDYFLSKKLFVFGIVGIETDTLADIDRRWYLGGGVGRQWREDEQLKWSSEVGVTYFDEEFRSNDDGEGYLAARIANNIAWKINDKTSLENMVEVFPSLEDKDDVYGKSDTKVKTSLSESMFAQLQWIFQYDNTPSPGLDRKDNQLILGIGWSF